MQRRKVQSPVWRELDGERCNWINIASQEKTETQRLGRRFPFLETVDLLECLPPVQRSKLVERPNYAFISLLFPVYNRQTRQIEPHELDIFLLPETLITIHDAALPAIDDLYDTCAATSTSKHVCLSGTALTMLVELLRSLQGSLMPMLVHIGRDIDELEKNIFDGRRKQTIMDILRVKTNIANFRKTIGAHKNVMKHLVAYSAQRFASEKLSVFMEQLVDQTMEIWDTLDNYKETIDALHESHKTVIESRTNDVIRVLTLFSGIMLPLTLFNAIFTSHATNGMPFIHSEYSFWILAAMQGVGIIAMIIYFRRKGWM